MVIDVIKQHCMEEKLQEEMREAVRQRADIMWLQNDCIYNAFVRPSLVGRDDSRDRRAVGIAVQVQVRKFNANGSREN